jgi:hypothetical protein
MSSEPDRLRDFATRYTAAWCSQNAVSVARHFAADGRLRVNEGTPAIGREAITKVVQGFMGAFPDLQVFVDQVVPRGERVEYHWTLTGTNSGPGGTGHRVRIQGYEDWRIGEDGLIADSQGHFDGDAYQHQLEHGI